MKEKVEKFFQSIEGVWAAIPTYVKVFLYSSVTAITVLLFEGKFDWMLVAKIVAVNLGIYQVPRTVGSQVRKAIK